MTDLKLAVQSCKCGELFELLLKDPIGCGITSDPVQARLLGEINLTLECSVDKYHVKEMATK